METIVRVRMKAMHQPPSHPRQGSVPRHRHLSPRQRGARAIRWLALSATAWLLAASAPALAEKRVALVIGNSAYKYAPALANPKNDAEGIAAALKRLKFEVIAGLDLDEAA